MAKPINRDKKTPDVVEEVQVAEVVSESTPPEVKIEIAPKPELLVEPVVVEAKKPESVKIAPEKVQIDVQEKVVLTASPVTENKTLLRETEEGVSKTKQQPYKWWW